MNLPLPRLRFRFGRLESTRTRLVFFAIDLSVNLEHVKLKGLSSIT